MNEKFIEKELNEAWDPQQLAKEDAEFAWETGHPMDPTEWEMSDKQNIMIEYDFTEEQAEKYREVYWDYYDLCMAGDSCGDSDASLNETKATGQHGRYQVEVFDEGDWHKLNCWSTVAKAIKAGEAAVEAVYQDYRVIDKDSGNEVEYITEGFKSKQTSTEIAHEIAIKARKAFNLSAYEVETLEHDINNLRAHEWIDSFKQLPETSEVRKLFFDYCVEEERLEGYRSDNFDKVADFNIGDRVAERWNDSEYNVGTVVEKQAGEVKVRWDFNDRGPEEEWVDTNDLTYWVEETDLEEGLFDKKKISVFNKHNGEGPKIAILDPKKEDEFIKKITGINPQNYEVCEYTEKNGKAVKGKPVEKYNKIMIDYQEELKDKLAETNRQKAQKAKEEEEKRKEALKKQPHWTIDPKTGARVYRDLVDAEDGINAQYNESMDADSPFTFTQVRDELKGATFNWQTKEDTFRYFYESEKDFAMEVLSKHYECEYKGTDEDGWHIIHFWKKDLKEGIVESTLKELSELKSQLDSTNDSLTEEKEAKKFEVGSERTFPEDSEEWAQLQKAADKLTKLSVKNFRYRVGNTYLDFGSGWQWTTILAKKPNEAEYQVLSPLAWRNIMNAQSEEALDAAIEQLRSDEYFYDKIKEPNINSSDRDVFDYLNTLDD